MDKEWDRVKEALKGPPNRENQEKAADALEKWKRNKPQNSKPVLCSLGLNKPYPREIPLDKLPDTVATNSAVYELMQKVVGKSRR